MRLATVVSVPPGDDLKVVFQGEPATASLSVNITAIPVDQLEVGDEVQVDVIYRQVVLVGRTGGVDPTPGPGTIHFAMLGPEFAATLEESAGNVILAQAAVSAGMIAVDAIDGTNIQDDSIETPHLVAESITGDKIVGRTILGDHIASFSIDAADAVFQAAAIKSADIDSITANQITAGALQVGSYIRSTSYVPGVSGWTINADGSVEFGSGIFRGTLQGASGTFSGTLSAAVVNGGSFTGAISSTATITGGTLRSASSGVRVEISGSRINFYGTGGLNSYIDASSSSGVSLGGLNTLWFFQGDISCDKFSSSRIDDGGFGSGSVQIGGGLAVTGGLTVNGVSVGGGSTVAGGQVSTSTNGSGTASFSHGLGTTPSWAVVTGRTASAPNNQAVWVVTGISSSTITVRGFNSTTGAALASNPCSLYFSCGT